VESYTAGGFDIENNSYTSGGCSLATTGIMKRNIAAPSVSVCRSVPPNTDACYMGTSMASPHVAATVALIGSPALELVGIIYL